MARDQIIECLERAYPKWLTAKVIAHRIKVSPQSVMHSMTPIRKANLLRYDYNEHGDFKYQFKGDY